MKDAEDDRGKPLAAFTERPARTVHSAAERDNRERGREEPPRRSRPRAPFDRRIVWAAAAVVLTGFGYALTEGANRPRTLVVLQRPSVSVTGEHPSTTGTPGSMSVELSFYAERTVHAFFLACDEGDNVLSVPHWFAREEASGRSVVMTAPRTSVPHAGRVLGFVVWGSERATRAVATGLRGLDGAASLAASEQRLIALAVAQGARVQRLPLAAP